MTGKWQENQKISMPRNLRNLRNNTYQKEQREYIQGQINKISRNSIDHRQLLLLARWTVNEMSRMKSTTRAKLKVAHRRKNTISRIFLENHG